MNATDALSSCDSAGKKMSINAAPVHGFAVEVSVADNGIGIPPDRLNQIFETFYTTKGHGTGLGLSIARTIVEMYGGRIWAENRPSGGAEFRFILPRADMASGAKDASAA